ncbi:putative lipoprotein [Mycobacterium xenopi 3993]|nr:putative lipoprotein [Mycobacterium xenopi 3993]
MAGRSVTAARLRRSWLVAVVIPAVVMGLGACGGNSGSAPAKVIFDKGTPFSDLLVPS